MQVKINGRDVTCFWLGFHKGTLVPGEGYRYNRDAQGHVVERAICWRWHRDGCPPEAEREVKR